MQLMPANARPVQSKALAKHLPETRHIVFGLCAFVANFRNLIERYDVMEVRNRIADVTKLRCNACQDFLKMVLVPDWKQKIYEKAKYEIENKTKYKDKYWPVYEKMRDIGIQNYSADDMDVTFIAEVLYGCRTIAPVQENTRKAIKALTEDRNLTDHSNENEEDDELYLRGLLALCNLRTFVRTVDRFETSIDDSRRMEYRTLYLSKIEHLKNTLDDERIQLIQRIRNFDKDIQRILDSSNPANTWIDIEYLYMNRYKLEKDPEPWLEFTVRASDAGVPYAHLNAVDYYIEKKDYAEAEHRIWMLLNDNTEPLGYRVHSIIDKLNTCLSQGLAVLEDMHKLLEDINSKGFNIKVNTSGYLYIEK